MLSRKYTTGITVRDTDEGVVYMTISTSQQILVIALEFFLGKKIRTSP